MAILGSLLYKFTCGVPCKDFTQFVELTLRAFERSKTYQLILIRRDGGENDLWEDKRLVLFLLEIGNFQIAIVGVSTKN